MKVRAPELVGHGGWIGVERPLSLAALRGKVVVLHFWCFGSMGCLRVIDDLRDLQRRFPTEVVVVGVHSPKFPHEGDHAMVRRAVARHRVNYPVLDDPDMVCWQQYGARGWPTLVVIDPRGDVAGSLAGDGQGPMLNQIVQDLVEEGRRRSVLRPERLPLALDAAHPQTLSFPAKVATDRRGRLVIADTGHDRVVVAELTGEHRARVTHLVTGLDQPHGVRLYGHDLVICDTAAGRVVRVDLAMRPGPDESVAPDVAGIIRLRVLPTEVIATDLAGPVDVIADVDRSFVIAEAGRNRLWRLPPDGSSAAVIAGDGYEGLVDGRAAEAELAGPSGLAILPNAVVFVDAASSALRVLSSRGKVATLVGEGLFDWGARDGRASVARLQHPQGVTASLDGEVLYVADTFNSALRAWDERRLQTLAVEGLSEPGGLDVMADGRLVVADTGNHRIVFVDPTTGALTPLSFDLFRLAEEPPAPTWGPPLVGSPGQALAVPFGVELGSFGLDLSEPTPVRIEVQAEPPWLLDHGPTAWAHVRHAGELPLQAGSIGSGLLTVNVTAAVASEGAVTTKRSVTQHPFVVR